MYVCVRSGLGSVVRSARPGDVAEAPERARDELRRPELWGGAGAPGPHRSPRSSAETGLRLR